MTQVLSTGNDNWWGWLSFDDDVNGNAGNDTLDGGGGNDTLNGGADNDRVIGGDGNDSLMGGSGNDTLIGGDGVNTLLGGSNNDVLALLTTFNPLVVNGDATATTFSLGHPGYGIANVGDARMFVSGTSMMGGAGDDTFNIHLFFTGQISVDGEGDNDTIDLRQSFLWLSGTQPSNIAPVSIDLQTGSGTLPFGGLLAISNVENIVGTNGEYVDDLRGTDGANVIVGLAGDDRLEGRGGADEIHGGTGFDIAQYTSAPGRVSVDLQLATQAQTFFDPLNPGPSQQNFDAAGDVLTSIEGVRGSAIYGDVLRGIDQTGYIESLFGDGGNDVLEGRGGIDSLDGGSGFDFVSYQSSPGAVQVLLSNGGFDSDAAGDRYVSIEGVLGSAHNDQLLGDDNDNKLFGGSGNDLINGFYGDNELRGDAGNDELIGGFDRDTLIGGNGADTLTGSGGADTFKFNLVSDSVAKVGFRDTIVDFRGGPFFEESSGLRDLIDLSVIDAIQNETSNVNQQFTFIGSSQFSAAGQVRVTSGTDPFGDAFNHVQAEVNGDGIADFSLLVFFGNQAPTTILTATEFVL